MTPREAIALLTKPKSKYRAVKCEWRGEKFDSQKELNRHLVLLDMQKRGEIQGLLRQPRYKLFVNERHICDYIGDWFYVEQDPVRLARHKSIVEDSKGFQTPEFKIKWALCKALYPYIEWRLS